MIERHTFFAAMAAQYGRALYALRPISALMNTEPLVVEGDASLAEFTGRALAERPSELLRGFVVVQNGRYAGVGSALSLLQATNAANRAHAEEMSRLAERLDLATREAQAALTAKSQFLAVMSHEIRTPLNGVLAVADILQRKLTDAALTPYVRTIQDSGETLLRLLTDALDLSRADAGRMELTEDSFHLPGLICDLACLWRPRAELKGLTASFTYRGDEKLWALGDAVRIKQVFNNLIGNALKFTETGEVAARLEAKRDDGGYVWLTGEVADTGVGVPTDRLTSIFEPFSQTEAGRREGGAGLGLAVCRQLVEQMDGAIEAAAREGGGTVFRFRIPLFETPAPQAEDTERTETAAGYGGLHILIADDNPTNRMVAQTLCELMGCSSECVEDGQQAVEAARHGRFDLILMDVRMPNMDGLEATARIRQMGGEVGRTPILALTANADPWDAQAYLAQGMDGVIEKPIKIERFMEAVAGLFGDAPGGEAVAA